MKKYLVSFLILLFTLQINYNLEIAGSSTIQPIMEKAAVIFQIEKDINFIAVG